MTKCKECGTDLDEIPFVECATHRTFEATQPKPSQQEIDDYLEYELSRLLHERHGDD